MASRKPVDLRVRAFVTAMLAERPPNDAEHIDDIERDMEQLADAVADEFAAQLLARQAAEEQTSAGDGPRCPHCGRVGRTVGERTRAIQTTRGSAPLVEPKCYCSACRRTFFPEVGTTGAADGV